MRAKYVFVLMLVMFSCLEAVAQDAWKGVLSKVMEAYSGRGQYFINSHAELRAIVDTAGLIEENDMLSWKVGSHFGTSMPFGYRIQEDTIELVVDTMHRYLVVRGKKTPSSKEGGFSLVGALDSLSKKVLEGDVQKLDGGVQRISMTFRAPYPVERLELEVSADGQRILQSVSYYREEMNFSTVPLEGPRFLRPKLTMTQREIADISKRPRVNDYVRLIGGVWTPVEKYKKFQFIRN